MTVPESPSEKMQTSGLHPRASPQGVYHVDVKAHEAEAPAPAPSAADKDTVVRYSLTTRALACASYGFTSVSITLFNKAVFAIYRFHYPNLVTTLQILVSITYMWLLRTGGVLKFADVTMQSAQQARVIAHIPTMTIPIGAPTCVFLVALRCIGRHRPALPQCAHVQVRPCRRWGRGCISHGQHIIHSTLRRVTTLVIALGEVQLFNKRPSFPASVCMHTSSSQPAQLP